MSKNSSNAACSALNRVMIACQDEIMTLNAAVSAFGGERGARLQRQAARRSAFRRDLGAGVVALGGIPDQGGSYAATVGRGLRALRRMVTGPHQGDAYWACADASGETAEAYSTALALDLPSEVRLGVGRQYREVEFDCRELHRLRCGATPDLTSDSRVDSIAEDQASSQSKHTKESEHTKQAGANTGTDSGEQYGPMQEQYGPMQEQSGPIQERPASKSSGGRNLSSG